MTEHVHKWEWIYRPEGVGPRYIGCQCGEAMKSDEMFRRVQATGRLSVSDAQYGAMCIDIVSEGHGESDKGTKAEKSLRSYANILEGE